MAKYSYEFKKKIVEEYLNNGGGYKRLAKKYGLPSKSSVKVWVHDYKAYGDSAFRGRSKNERTARVIHSLRGEFRLKDLLSILGMPKATYMYWQKRLDYNPEQELENKIKEIRAEHKDRGYRRITGELRKSMTINKKKVHRICKNMAFRSHPLLEKAENTVLIKAIKVKLLQTGSAEDLILSFLIKRSQQIPQNSNITKSMKMGK